MNQVNLMGRLTNDPEFLVGKTGNQFATFTIAVSREFVRDGETDVDFFKCVCFGKTAETINKFFVKGSMIQVTGRLRNNAYEKDGVKKQNTDIVVEKFHFTGEKKKTNFINNIKTDNIVYEIDENEQDLPF